MQTDTMERGEGAADSQHLTSAEAANDPTVRRRSYALVICLYALLLVAAVAFGRRRGIRLPERLATRDLVLSALATQRLARLVAKEPVTIPLRAPFTEFVGVAGPAELEERARDDSRLRHTVGELLTCPFCLGQWFGTAFVVGHVVWPKATRLVASTFAVVGVADSLQHATGWLRTRTSK